MPNRLFNPLQVSQLNQEFGKSPLLTPQRKADIALEVGITQEQGTIHILRKHL